MIFNFWKTKIKISSIISRIRIRPNKQSSTLCKFIHSRIITNITLHHVTRQEIADYAAEEELVQGGLRGSALEQLEEIQQRKARAMRGGSQISSK